MFDNIKLNDVCTVKSKRFIENTLENELLDKENPGFTERMREFCGKKYKAVKIVRGKFPYIVLDIGDGDEIKWHPLWVEKTNVMKLNNTRHKVGDVVYYIDKRQGNWKWKVSYGVISDVYSSSYSVERYRTRENRIVNGIRFSEFPFGEKTYKIPKGFDILKDDLVEITYEEQPRVVKKALSETKISDKEGIKNIISRGFLIPVKEYDFGRIETSYENNGTYKIVKKYDFSVDDRPYLTIDSLFVYDNYEDAKACVDSHYAEIQRAASLSDLEWSKEGIEDVLQRYKEVNRIDDDDIINKYRTFLFSLDNLDSVECRLFHGDVQWKYEKNKRYKNIEVF